MIAIVDYGMGNLRSVEKAFHHVGAEVSVVSDAARVMAARGVVLPGVGAFGDCMANLARLGLVEAVREVVRQGRPFLGICLGMQALFESSEEAPGVAGLGLLAGSVPRFRAAGLKVPHMGWNQLRIRRPDCPLLAGVADGSFVYFVHSYFCEPRDGSVTCATAEYGEEFCAMLWSGRVFATQFHPEKSQAVGLRILENFVKVCG
ncbi:MAG: imidazole glycerol phosphate synthase subunit HisH [Verrucomicrobiae bacterium]|nr:imidazole glycerol phosphate synthase subunit HisH [Verrucomicrobiae bacterium]